MRALIFGITGQTGSFLAEHLLKLGYTVYGVIRRSSSFNTGRLSSIWDLIGDNLRYGDIIDPLLVRNLIEEINPDEIYNLAAQSHVKVSFDLPFYTTQIDAIGTLNILESIRVIQKRSQRDPDRIIKFYQANTSEMFGGTKSDYKPEEWEKILKCGMDETSLMFPKSPYGAAKLYAHNLVHIYRESYNIFAVSGICFNHESERRDPRFVTRKITRSVARIYLNLPEILILGNLDAERDWGYAGDYVVAMQKMLQYEKPSDFVVSTGRSFTVRYLVEHAFQIINKKIKWIGSGVEEKGILEAPSGLLTVVKVSEKYYRPNEVPFLRGNSTKAQILLNWKPEVTFEEMIKLMVEFDIAEEKKKIFFS